MKTTVKGGLACLLMLSGAMTHAEMNLIAPDGKRVLLKDDMTWEYVDQANVRTNPARRAYLSVETVADKGTSCQIGLRMRNGLADEIGNIVLSFSAYTENDILYETVTKDFHTLKPTNNQYQEITFRGVQCKDIKTIRVHSGDHCTIGELNKFSDAPGKCLDRVSVEATNKISIYKRYSDKAPPPKAKPAAAAEAAK